MSDATGAAVSRKPEQIPISTLVVGVALSSFSALLLELSLTRLFSVVLFYHFAFLAISIALLGLGAGGVCAYLARTILARLTLGELAASLCCLNALVIPVVLLIVLRVPVSLELSRENFLHLMAMYMASAVPFFLTGLQFSIVFARQSEQIPRLYGADLTGGALACLGVVPLLNWVGGPNAILVAALAAAAAGFAWFRRVPPIPKPGNGVAPSGFNWPRKSASKPKPGLDGAPHPLLPKVAAGLTTALLILIVLNHSGRIFDVIYAKGIFRDRAWVEFARWNAISRVEVDRQGAAKAIVIDADASTYIMNADPGRLQGTQWERNLMSAPPALVNVLRPHGEYAIIGPGGGVDVLRAVANGSRNVTGIEINPIIANTIMRDRYADYAYHLYEQPDVHIHVTDGRSFIRNADQKFDVVQMTLVDTWASTAAGAFALSENSLYTVEAFTEYFDHLRPDGIIAVTRWEFRQPREALRVVSVAIEALHRMGVENPARNFIVVSEGDLDEDGIPVAVLAKKSAFMPEEERSVSQHLARFPALVAMYTPSGGQRNPFSDLIASNDSNTFASKYAYNVSPVYDNAPFFFFTLKLSQILHQESVQQGIDWKVNLGVAVLGLVFMISIAAVIFFLVIPLVLGGRGQKQRVVPLVYFIAVGLAYILVEIAFIQRFVLFLGHPTYALTVVVFLLLLSSGVGSLFSREWLDAKCLRLPLALIVLALSLYVGLLPRVLNGLVGVSFLAKLMVSGLLLAPLGFAMGMPFPTGLRMLSGSSSKTATAVEWAWAMNAAASVLGSVLAIVIAIQFGLTVTLTCGAVAYLLALVLMNTLRPKVA
jgi:spermidine synthase